MTAIFNISSTPNGRVAKILDFIARKDNFYIAIGRESPWGPQDGLNIDDLNPPIPTGDEILFDNPIIYKKVDIVTPVIIGKTCLDIDLNSTSVNGTIVANTSAEKGLVFTPEQNIVLTDGDYLPKPNAVFISASFMETDYTAAGFRSAAFFSSIQLDNGITEGLTIYQPNEVVNGVLDWITFNTPVLRDSNKEHKIELIINF